MFVSPSENNLKMVFAGASIGLEYYLKPDFSKLTESSVWIDAATQV